MNYVDTAFKSSLTSISIGPGIRGIERGVERVVRLRHLAYVEIEAFIIENLVAEMELGLLDPAAIWSDCKTMPCEPFRGITDILFAGYPCQPFSTAGRRKGTEDPRHLFPYIERAVRIIQPRICFFENVRGHVTCGLAEVIASLEGLGYRVHWGIYSAEETGASHKRERVFILAMDNTAHNRYHSTMADTYSDESQRDGRSGGMENQAGQNKGKENQWQWLRDAARSSCEAVADTRCVRSEIGQKQSSGIEQCSKMVHSDHQQINSSIGGLRGESDSASGEAELDDSTSSRLETRREFQSGSGQGLQKSISGDETPIYRVSRPGQPQQAWEHPRIIFRAIESAVGLSAHGYHFREDVLRALGNSVYEDTAELAFKDLLRKHGIEL